MAADACEDGKRPAFDPRQRRAPRPAIGGPPSKDQIGSAAPAEVPPEPRVAMAMLEPAETTPGGSLRVAPGMPPADETRIPGSARTPGSRQIHTTLSERAHRLLDAARADQPDTSYGELVVAALRESRAALVAGRPPEPEDPFVRPPRARRLRVEGKARSRPFHVTAAQAEAILALAAEAGIPNLSELVERAVESVYSPLYGPAET